MTLVGRFDASIGMSHGVRIALLAFCELSMAVLKLSIKPAMVCFVLFDGR